VNESGASTARLPAGDLELIKHPTGARSQPAMRPARL